LCHCCDERRGICLDDAGVGEEGQDVWAEGIVRGEQVRAPVCEYVSRSKSCDGL
jgi:hypothetical protein